MWLYNVIFLNVVFLLGRFKKYNNNKIIILQKSRPTPKLNIDTKVKTCVRHFNSILYYICCCCCWMIRCIQFWLREHTFITVPSFVCTVMSWLIVYCLPCIKVHHTPLLNSNASKITQLIHISRKLHILYTVPWWEINGRII